MRDITVGNVAFGSFFYIVYSGSVDYESFAEGHVDARLRARRAKISDSDIHR